MSLKVLKAEYYDGEEHTYYVAGCDMLSYLDSIAKVTEASFATGSQRAPISGMHDRVGWQKAINTLSGHPEQFIKLAGTTIRKAPDSYYMNAVGIDTHGVRERGGPSYNEFRGLVSDLGSDDGKIAGWIRGILTNAMSAAPEHLRAVPALAATLMLAEPKRNKRAFPINLMLLDFLEHNVQYGSKQNKSFSWDNILWRTGFGGDKSGTTKSYDYSGGAVTHERHERGGKLPMSNTSAVQQSQQGIPAHPPANTQFYFPNAEQDKEGTIIVRWLQHYLNANYGRGFLSRTVQILGTGDNIWERKRTATTENVTYMITYTGLPLVNASQFSYVDINQPFRGDDWYKRHFYEAVRGALDWRNGNLTKPPRL